MAPALSMNTDQWALGRAPGRLLGGCKAGQDGCRVCSGGQQEQDGGQAPTVRGHWQRFGGYWQRWCLDGGVWGGVLEGLGQVKRVVRREQGAHRLLHETPHPNESSHGLRYSMVYFFNRYKKPMQRGNAFGSICPNDEPKDGSVSDWMISFFLYQLKIL
jgi:hypothetical protein